MRQSFRFAIILGLVLAVCSTARAQNLYSTSAIIPQGIAVAQLGPITTNDTSSHINITVTSTLCDSEGNNCGTAYPGISAKVQLACGNVDSQEADYVSELIGGVQTIIISPQSPSYLVGNQTEPSFSCAILPEDYLPGSISFNLSAEALSNYTVQLSQPEQDNAKLIYDACCSQKGACGPWDQATEAAGLDFTTGAAFTDLCNVDGNICSPEGNLITWDLLGYNLACNASSLDFANFTSLQHLILSGNNLTGNVDDIIQNLVMHEIPISDLRVNSNPVLGGMFIESTNSSTPALCQLTGLQQLLFGGTSIAGSIPPCLFSSTSSLEQLYGSASDISGPLADLSTSTKLRVLQVMGTNLTGSIPAIPPTLLKLNLSMNALSGPLVDPGVAPDLVSIDVSNNELDGELPENLADHPHLILADFRNNKFSALPTAWEDHDHQAAVKGESALPPLQYLFLSENPLQGPFPAGLMMYPNLTLLDLDATGIEGNLPDIMDGGFPALYALYAANNSLSGAIPESWNKTNLFSLANYNASATEDDTVRYFILSNNSLSGNLPSWLAGPFPSYMDIELRGNTFDNACDAQFNDLSLCPEGAAGADTTTSPAPTPTTTTTTTNTTADTSTTSDTAADTEDEESSGGLSTGAKAGIAIGVLILVGLLGYGGYVLWRRRREGSDYAGKFQRFDDQGNNVEMSRSNTGYYNSQLQP